MVNLKKIIMVTAMAATISACGGGGDSASSTTNKAPAQSNTATLSMSLGKASVQLNESESTSFDVSINYTGNDSLSYSLQTVPASASIYANINASGESITVTANDVDGDVEYSVKVTLSDGTVTDTANFNVSISDTSFAEEASLWADASSSFAFNDLENAADFYIQAAYFSGSVTFSEKTELESEFSALLASSREQSDGEEMEELKRQIDQYSSGSSTKEKLVDALATVKTLATAQNIAINDKFNEIAQLSNGILPQLTAGTYQYVKEYNVFSSVIGNTGMGSFNDDVWTFSSEFDLLNSKVPALGNTETCETN